jgi:hypothetical protein
MITCECPLKHTKEDKKKGTFFFLAFVAVLHYCLHFTSFYNLNVSLMLLMHFSLSSNICFWDQCQTFPNYEIKFKLLIHELIKSYILLMQG